MLHLRSVLLDPGSRRLPILTQEIFACNEALKTYSHARLVREGRKLASPEFG